MIAGKAASRRSRNNGREELNFTMTIPCTVRRRDPISPAIRSVDSASRRIGFANPRRLMRQKRIQLRRRIGRDHAPRPSPGKKRSESELY